MPWLVFLPPVVLVCALLVARQLIRLITSRNAVQRAPADGLAPAVSPVLELAGSWGIVGRYRRWISKRLVQSILLRGTENAHAVVTNCAGSSSPTSNDGNVRIFYRSAPEGLPRVGKLSTGAGVPLTLDNGDVVGEICGKSIFVYDDILKRGPRKGVLQFAQILLTARREMNQAADANRELLKRRFIAEGTQIRHSVNARAAALAVTEERFHSALAANHQAESAMLGTESRSEKQLEQEYEALLRVEKVLRVQVTPTQISVFTDYIDCPDARTGLLHRLGKFEIRISLDQPGKIRFFNLTNTLPCHLMGTAPAPHVYASGKACLGTIKFILPGLLRKRDYAVGVQVAIAFLQSANTNDWGGRRVSRWPVVGVAT